MRLWALFLLFAAVAPATTFYVTVSGLGGEPDYDQRFAMWAKDIDQSLHGAPDAKVFTLTKATRAQVKSALEDIAREAKPSDALVVTLIGHGSYDGVEYKINLPGPDLSAAELAALMDRIPATRQLLVNTTSCGGGAFDVLRKNNRVIVSATKTGTEKNATVFARYWAEALRDPAADTDKNETISALEAYRYADRKTVDFYTTQKRLATEHAVLQDSAKSEPARAPSAENGQGMLAASFPLLRLGSAAAAARTPQKRALLEKKEQIEQQIDQLKYQKAALPAEEYKRQLTALLLQLAQTQQELDQ
jgi:hypothetical protein